MIKNFEGKVAVITGAGSGIGFSMAKAFAEKGMKIVLAEIDEKRLKRAERRLNKTGADILALKIDVSDPKQVERLAEESFKRFGNVNILCNNAGIGGSGPLHLLEIGDWDNTLGTNLFGVIYGIKYFTSRMLASGEPCHIINTASLAGHLATGENGPYSASKFAVVSISENLAQELFNTNVGVSVLCPGFINTNIAENSIALREGRTDLYELNDMDDASQIYLANFIKIIKLGMHPDIVAKMVIHAIENDIFFIMTHHEWMNLIKARFDRINEDSSKTRKAFPVPEREIVEKKYEYNSDVLSFSISYPNYFVDLLPTPNTSQVFLAAQEFRQTLEIYVSDIDNSVKPENIAEFIANNLKLIGTDIKIISDKEMTLEDGTPSHEIEIEYTRLGTIKMKSHHVSVIKDNKMIRVSTSTHPYYFNDDHINITRSLKFTAPIAEIPQ
ncbi:MAG: SDR family NAD(P)-dependent oxidoreductase [Candidatus Thorarchaeota archaeon]